MIRYIVLVIPIVLIIQSCQKDLDGITENGIIVTSTKDTLLLNLNETADINIYLTEDYPKAKFNITIEGGMIDGDTVLENVPIFDDTLKMEFTPGSKTGKAYIKVKPSDSDYTVVKELILIKDDLENILSIEISDTTGVIADKQSIFYLNVTVSNHKADSISLTLSNGKFSNGQSTLAVNISNGFTSIPITTSQSALPHTITATLNNPYYSKNITFTPTVSLPETITLTTNSWTIDSTSLSVSDAILLTAHLDKTVGLVSEGIAVETEAYQMINGTKTNFGSFDPFLPESNSSEQISANYFLSPGAYPDSTLFIVFSCQGIIGNISDTLNLTVN